MSKKNKYTLNNCCIIIGFAVVSLGFKYTYSKSSVLEYIFQNFSFITICLVLAMFSQLFILGIADNIKLLKNIPTDKHTKIDDYAFSLLFISWSVIPLLLLLGHFDEEFFTIVGIPVAVSLSLFSSYKKFFKWTRPESKDTLNKSRVKRKRTSNRKYYKRLNR